MPLLGGIAGLMRWLEELIVILSAPLLMFGLIVALVDLLTDGSLSLAVPWLITAWAVSQAIGVEANMSGAAFKMRASWKAGSWFAVFGYLVLVLALAGVAVVAGYAYAYHQSQGVAIPQTLRDLGIDAASWTFVRSVLSVALVILSGLLRYTGEKAKAQDEAQRLREEIELAPLRAQANAVKMIGVRSVVQAVIRGAPVDDQPPTGPGTPVQATPAASGAAADAPEPRQLRAMTVPRQAAATNTGSTRRRRRRVRNGPGRRESAEAKVRAVWQPGMSLRQLEAAAGIGRSTASKWARIMESEAAQQVAR